MSKKVYSIEFQDQALIKARQRGERSLLDVANDLNMPEGTLRKWLGRTKREKDKVSDLVVPLPEGVPAQSWGAAERLQALLETHLMPPMQLNAWCRQKGLFEHQLQAWREGFCGSTAAESRESRVALRELQLKHDELQRQMRRKDKALAEAAALLVLQKKFQALFAGEQ